LSGRVAFDFAGLIEAAAFGVEFRAMIAAANAAFLELAVVERIGRRGLAVPEQDEILAERANFSGDIAGAGDEPDRVPWCSPIC
jgi:hypothetical protein